MKNIITIGIFILLSAPMHAQNIIRFSVGATVDSTGSLIETIDFDLNRTESEEEKINDYAYPINGSPQLFWTPGLSINLGAGVEASSNDIVGKINFIYLIPDNGGKDIGRDPKRSKKRFFFQSFEANPTLNADKNFRERLFYVQGRYKMIFLIENYPAVSAPDEKIKRARLVINPYLNLGGRNSRDFSSTNIYFTGNAYGDFIRTWGRMDDKLAFYKKAEFKISSDFAYILAESSQYSSIAPLRFSSNISFDYYFCKNLSFGIFGKLGDLSPTYERFNNAGLSVKWNKK